MVVLTLEKAFSYKFHFKAKEKAYVLLKSSTRDFQKSPPFERSVCFYEIISRNFETNFMETRTFFKKLEYYFLNHFFPVSIVKGNCQNANYKLSSTREVSTKSWNSRDKPSNIWYKTFKIHWFKCLEVFAISYETIWELE